MDTTDKPEATSLGTADALTFADLKQRHFDDYARRGVLKGLPPTKRGPPGRYFGPDDLIALDAFSDLLAIGVVPRCAGAVAGELRIRLRENPTAQRMYLVTVESGANGMRNPAIVLEPPADSILLFVLDVARARRAARQAIEDRRGP